MEMIKAVLVKGFHLSVSQSFRRTHFVVDGFLHFDLAGDHEIHVNRLITLPDEHTISSDSGKP